MPVGLSIASHSGLPPARVGQVAALADQAGFSAVFVAEGHGDALSLCHPVAAGIDLPVLFPMPVGPDWGYETAIERFRRS